MRTIPKSGEIENTMTELLLGLRVKSDSLCKFPSDCAEASSMITTLNNIALDVHPPVRVYSGAGLNPTLNDWN
jgi:hypothetical protein